MEAALESLYLVGSTVIDELLDKLECIRIRCSRVRR